MKISYVGLNSLDSTEREIVKKLVSSYSDKINRYGGIPSLRVFLKLYKKQGKEKYSMHARLEVKKEVIDAKVYDWDIRRTTHAIMQKLLNGLEHKFHRDQQKQQKFHPKKGKRGFGKNIKMKLKGLVKFI